MYPSFLYLATVYVAGVQSAGLPSSSKPGSSSILADVAASQPELTDLPSLVKRQREDGRCGKSFDGAPCARDECCSAEGWCGHGYLYCSAPACQIDYGPACDANVRPQGVDTEGTRRTHDGSVPYGKGIYHCEKLGAIALTYDDGPYDYTEYLLDILQAYQAKATFFITGNNLGKGAINDPQYAWAGLIQRMIRDGHQVASHTWGHQRLTSLSQSQLRRQMIYNEIAIADIIGVFPTYMRPPYSASNDDTDSWLGDLGYHITYFNLDTEGYLHDNASAIQTSKNIWDKNVEGKDPQSIHFLQIEHDPVYQSVHNLTEYILKSMARNGLETVTVGECLNDPKKNWYRLPPNATHTEAQTPINDEEVDEDDEDDEGDFFEPSHPLTPTVDGRCGSAHKGQTCEQETVLGETCCSRYGWCGNTTAHCTVGCQPIYGTCD